MRPLVPGRILSGLILLALATAACAPSAAPQAPAGPAGASAQPASSTGPQASAAGQPGTGSAAFSPAVAQLVEGARREPTFRGAWPGNVTAGQAGLDTLIAGLNKKYGLNVQAQFTPSPDMNTMAARLSQEVAAGQPAASDMYLGHGPGINVALNNHVLQSMDWPAILDRPIPVEPDFDAYAPEGVGVALMASIGGISYNTNLVRGDDVPRRLEDLLQPQWRGVIAATPVAFGLRELAAPDMLGREYMVSYTQRLSQQIGGLIRCGDESRVASGEFAMLVFSCGEENAAELRRNGAPMDFTTLADGTAMLTYYGSVPKTSRAPNTAALLVAYLSSAEGQQQLWEVSRRDLWVYPQSNSRKLLDNIRASGGKLASGSPQWLASMTGFPEMQRELEAILQQSAR
jgi:ABC-type Fe3+ transport system substrate-binding protein